MNRSNLHLALALLPLMLVMASSRADSAIESRAGVVPAAVDVLGVDNASKSVAALERAFADPITIVMRLDGADSNQTPGSCLKLLTVQSSIVGVRPVSDWAALQDQLVTCTALKWLTTMATPKRSALPSALKLLRSTSLWPVSLWPNPDASSGAAQGTTKKSLRKVSGLSAWKHVAAQAGASEHLSLVNRDYQLSVELLARGDFNGDGWEDWLISWRAKAITGSWYNSRSMVLSRMTQHGSLTELPLSSEQYSIGTP